jgi:ribosome assembly protein YihI (activator of Der GTPase)
MNHEVTDAILRSLLAGLTVDAMDTSYLRMHLDRIEELFLKLPTEHEIRASLTRLRSMRRLFAGIARNARIRKR